VGGEARDGGRAAERRAAHRGTVGPESRTGGSPDADRQVARPAPAGYRHRPHRHAGVDPRTGRAVSPDGTGTRQAIPRVAFLF